MKNGTLVDSGSDEVLTLLNRYEHAIRVESLRSGDVNELAACIAHAIMDIDMHIVVFNL